MPWTKNTAKETKTREKYLVKKNVESNVKTGKLLSFKRERKQGQKVSRGKMRGKRFWPSVLSGRCSRASHLVFRRARAHAHASALTRMRAPAFSSAWRAKREKTYKRAREANMTPSGHGVEFQGVSSIKRKRGFIESEAAKTNKNNKRLKKGKEIKVTKKKIRKEKTK